MTNTSLKRSKDVADHAVPGLWENDIVRMERVNEGWQFQVPAREIGTTDYLEFRPLTMGGKWRNAGVRRTREGCCRIAKKLQSGECVLKPGTGSGDGRIPAQILDWSAVRLEIAEHPSVKGSVE